MPRINQLPEDNSPTTTDLVPLFDTETSTTKHATVADLAGLVSGTPTGGTTGQALVKASDTDFDTEWATVSGGGGLSNVVEDTTPQLGGDLDAQDNDITNVTQLFIDYLGGNTDANVDFDVNANFLGTLSVSSVAVVTTSGTQTLTNKTISGSSNTLSDIGNSSLTNSSITIAGNSTALGGSVTQDNITGLSSTGIIKRTGANTLAVATSGSDYAPATSGSAILKGNGTGGFSSASSGTDYAPATSGSAILKGNGSGGFSSAVAGTDYSTPSSTDTLTNKTFDANGTGNTISNLEVADLAAGVLDTDLSSVAGTDTTIPSAKATKTALDLKAPLASPSFTGTVTLPTGLTGVLRADSGVVSTDTDVTDIVAAASTSAAGKVELATAAETTTGTDADRAVTPDGLAGSDFGIRVVGIQVFGSTTNTATGDGKAFFRVPVVMNGWTIVGVAACVYTAGTTGTTDIQIRNKTDSVDVLSTKLTIDSGETDSSTAATAAVINTSNDDLATGDLIAIDVDAVSTTPAVGLFVEIRCQAP